MRMTGQKPGIYELEWNTGHTVSERDWNKEQRDAQLTLITDEWDNGSKTEHLAHRKRDTGYKTANDQHWDMD